MKTAERGMAIKLRQEGKTYSEILLKVPVAKSTLSEWLRGVGLAKKQRQRITKLKIKAQLAGAESRRKNRLCEIARINAEALREIAPLTDREKLLIGIILYWAEGSKQKDWRVSQQLCFTNSDPLMIRAYIAWLRGSLHIAEKDIIYSLYIHESSKRRLNTVIAFWRELAGLQDILSDKVYFKRHKSGVSRRNLGDRYYGTMRIQVRKSSLLNRRVSAWINAVAHHCGVV